MTSYKDFCNDFVSPCNIRYGEILPTELTKPMWAKCVTAEAEAWERGYETAVRTIVAVIRENSASAIAANVDFSPIAWQSLAERIEKMK